MYCFIRTGLAVWYARKMPELEPYMTHEFHTRCWPWDIDMFGELNSGRSLSLTDSARLALAVRSPLLRVMRRNGWYMTMAGCTAQYRRRITMFQRLTISARIAGWDERFFYLEQLISTRQGPAHTAVHRVAVVGQEGIIPIADVIAQMGEPYDKLGAQGSLPAWLQGWADAERERPWPPEGFGDP